MSDNESVKQHPIAVSVAQVRWAKQQLKNLANGATLPPRLTREILEALADTPLDGLPDRRPQAGDVRVTVYGGSQTLEITGAHGKPVSFTHRHSSEITGGWGVWVCVREADGTGGGTIGITGAEAEALYKFLGKVLAGHDDRPSRKTAA
jgi:hypothetical protein